MGEEGALVRQIAETDSSDAERRVAERELCTRLAPRIRLYGLRHLRNESAAADLVQEALLVLLASVREGKVREAEHVDRFVFGICRNLVAKIHRGGVRARRFENAVLPLTEDEMPPAFTSMDAARLAICLGRLGVREQRVVLLTFQDGASTEQVASEIGTSPGNIRVMRHRAMAALQQCVEGWK